MSARRSRRVRLPYDQAIKQLLAEFTRETLAFFAPDAAAHLPGSVTFTLLRQEQVSEIIGKGHREVDCAILARWGEAQAEVLLILVEGEARPSRPAVYKIDHYVLDLALWMSSSG